MQLYWESIVAPNEDILHLGDVMWYKNDTPWSEGKTLGTMVKELPGNKFLIKGNHDKENDEWWNNLGFEIMSQRVFFKNDNKTILFTHFPEKEFDIGWDINIHGHIHNNGYITREENGRKFINVSVEVMGYTPVKLRDILISKEV